MLSTSTHTKGHRAYCQSDGATTIPRFPEAIPHIDRIEKNKALCEKCFRTIGTAGLTRRGNDLYFDHLEGKPFDSTCIDYSSASLEKIRKDINVHLKSLMDDISDGCRCTFKKTKEFEEMFGDADIEDGVPALTNINLDMFH